MHLDDYGPDYLTNPDFLRLEVSLYSCKFIYILNYKKPNKYEVCFCYLFLTFADLMSAKLSF